MPNAQLLTALRQIKELQAAVDELKKQLDAVKRQPGPAGPPGPAGAKGDKGDKGDRGAPGPGIDAVELQLLPPDGRARAELVRLSDGQRLLKLFLPRPPAGKIDIIAKWQDGRLIGSVDGAEPGGTAVITFDRRTMPAGRNAAQPNK